MPDNVLWFSVATCCGLGVAPATDCFQNETDRGRYVASGGRKIPRSPRRAQWVAMRLLECRQ